MKLARWVDGELQEGFRLYEPTWPFGTYISMNKGSLLHLQLGLIMADMKTVLGRINIHHWWMN